MKYRAFSTVIAMAAGAFALMAGSAWSQDQKPLLIGMNADPDVLDMTQSTNPPQGLATLVNVYESLVRADPQGHTAPALAESWDVLDGGKTIANYWPYATTLFDFIRRSMPFTQPRSLTDHEVYSLVAYLLAENKLIGNNDEMNAATLPKVRMPNHDNFIVWFPDRI